MRDLQSKYGPYALVTGATAGIGEQFAVQLAEAGFNLVLVARRKQKMDALAASLHSRFDVAVEIVELDLAAENATTEPVRRTQHVDIGLVIVSAGIFTSGPFIGNTLPNETQLVTVNALVPMQPPMNMAAPWQRGTVEASSSSPPPWAIRPRLTSPTTPPPRPTSPPWAKP